MSRPLLKGVVIGIVLLTGCGQPPVDPPPEYGPLSVGGGPEDGSNGFVELSDGQDVTLVPGAQGGFHVYLNVRVEERSMSTEHTLYIDRKARRADTQQLVSQNRQLAVFIPSMGDPEIYETERPMLMFLCPAPIGIQVNDQMLTVNVRGLLHHRDMEPIAEGTISLTPRCPENDKKDFCLKICSGE